MGWRKPPQGFQRDLCQLLKVLNPFPSEAAGGAEIHGNAPEIFPLVHEEEWTLGCEGLPLQEVQTHAAGLSLVPSTSSQEDADCKASLGGTGTSRQRCHVPTRMAKGSSRAAA